MIHSPIFWTLVAQAWRIPLTMVHPTTWCTACLQPGHSADECPSKLWSPNR